MTIKLINVININVSRIILPMIIVFIEIFSDFNTLFQFTILKFNKSRAIKLSYISTVYKTMKHFTVFTNHYYTNNITYNFIKITT